jgi:predicted ATPase/DNA-binding SARP family transcriptional activator
MSVEARLLGPPAIVRGENRHEPAVGKLSALLYHLAIRGGWVARDALAFLFWPDTDDASARHNLRNLIQRSKRLPFIDGIEIERNRLRWLLPSDVAAFRQAAPDDPGAALDLYRGPLLDGFSIDDAPEFMRWLEGERAELEVLWRGCLERRIEGLEGQSAFERAAEAVEALLRRDPYDEPALRRQLELLGRAGRSDRALRRFERYRVELDRDFAATPEQATLALAARLRDAPEAPAPAPTPTPAPTPEPEPAARHNLPRQPTPFVGRGAERARIAEQLDDPHCRLLTLVAPGGVGKTRLALEVAHEQLAQYVDGVRFVPLAEVRSVEGMVPALIDALELPRSAQDARLQLFEALRHRRLLLVLDNLEHLPGGATLVRELLDVAPAVKVLATSRTRLDLRDEWLIDLGGLGYPEVGEAPDPERHDAVRLFLRHADRLEVGANPAEVLPIVAQICRLVDGMPLAIELAASWLPVLTPEDIRDEIERGIDLLSSSAHDMPERHRSIRTVFDTSWALLAEPERQLLRRLAVFQGGFRREAAAEVAGATLPLLAGLVRKGLLGLRPDGRYRRHPLVAQYSRERLALDDEERAASEAAHGRYYVAFLERWYDELYGGRQAEALAAFAEEMGNLEVTWEGLVGERRPEELRHAAGLFNRYHGERHNYREGAAMLADGIRALDDGDPDHRFALGCLLQHQAWLLFRSGDIPEVRAAAERAAALLEPFGSTPERMECLNVLGAVATVAGDLTTARGFFERSLAMARSADTVVQIGYALNNLALVAHAEGSYEVGMEHARDALRLTRSVGNRYDTARYLGVLAMFYTSTGRFERARAALDEGLEIAREGGYDRALPTLMAHRAALAMRQGDLEGAERLWRERLALDRNQGARPREVESLRNLAKLAADRDPQGSPQAFLEAFDLAADIGFVEVAAAMVVDVAEVWQRRGDLTTAATALQAVLQSRYLAPRGRARAEGVLKGLERSLAEPAWRKALAAADGWSGERLLERIRELLGAEAAAP